jgi:hypothetical protein
VTHEGSSLFRVGGSGEPPAAGAVEGRSAAISVLRSSASRRRQAPCARGSIREARCQFAADLVALDPVVRLH